MSQIETIKNAIALIQTESSRGTGYLITQDIVITCAHVIKPKNKGERVDVRVGTYQGNATVEAIDADADCAVLRLPRLLGSSPLPLAARGFKRGDTWETYGYPAITSEAGHWLTGDIQDSKDKDPTGRDAIVLFSREIAAADGTPPQGFSGSPVLVSGQVVGHLKQIIPNPNDFTAPRAMMGTLYACPSEVIRNLLPSQKTLISLPPQPPTVGYDPAWYVERQEEENAINFLMTPGAPAVLWGPFRSGKTTLLQRILEKLEQQSVPPKIVLINLGLFDKEATQTLDTLLLEMAQQLVDEIAPECLLDKVWDSPLGSVKKMTRLMSKELLTKVEGNLVLAIDKVDEIWKQNFKNDFFGMFRSWSELNIRGKPTDRPLWSKLRLILVISSSPTSLIGDHNFSPFNLADPIEVEDLRPNQINNLAIKYGLSWNDDDFQKISKLFGGHPYLLRVLMYHSSLPGNKLDALLNRATLHKVYSIYFEQYRYWLNKNKPLKEEFDRHSFEESLQPNNLEACYSLVRAGLLIEDEAKPGRYKLRYGLFSDLFL